MRLRMSKARRYMWGGFVVIVCFALILAFLPPDLPRHIIKSITIVAPIGIIAGIVLWLYGRRERVKENYRQKNDGGLK